MKLPQAPASLSDRDYPPDPHLLVLQGWFLILLAVPLALWIGSRIQDKRAVPDWPTTRAEVQGSKLYHDTGKGGRGWCLRLAYRYQVDGRFYNSSGVDVPHLGHAGCNRSQAVMRERLARMQEGDIIDVHYHPRQHARSAAHIEPLDAGDYMFSGGAIGLFLIGVASILHGRHLRAREALDEARRALRLRQARQDTRAGKAP